MIAVPAGQNTELVGAYVAEKTGCAFQVGLYQAIAVINDQGDFCAGVVISDYRGHDCQLSCAAETAVSWRYSVLRAVFDYVFNQLGCVRCTSITKKSNKRTREFLTALGFKMEGRLRRGFDGTSDGLIYGLLVSECRFLNEGVDHGDIVGNATGGTEATDSQERTGISRANGQEAPSMAGGAETQWEAIAEWS